MKLKTTGMQGVYWSSLLCAVVRQSSTGLVLRGGNPPPAVVAFRPRPAAAAAAASWSRRRHEAPYRRAHHHMVGRTGRTTAQQCSEQLSKKNHKKNITIDSFIHLVRSLAIVTSAMIVIVTPTVCVKRVELCYIIISGCDGLNII